MVKSFKRNFICRGKDGGKIKVSFFIEFVYFFVIVFVEFFYYRGDFGDVVIGRIDERE